MKKLLILFAVVIPIISNGQNVDTNPSLKTPIDKIREFDKNTMRVNYSDAYSVANPMLPVARTSEDSISLKGQEIPIVNNYVRLDPSKIESLFPETVTIDAENKVTIDYLSFIPILLDAINEQQKVIDDLKKKIQLLENK